MTISKATTGKTAHCTRTSRYLSLLSTWLQNCPLLCWVNYKWIDFSWWQFLLPKVVFQFSFPLCPPFLVCPEKLTRVAASFPSYSALQTPCVTQWHENSKYVWHCSFDVLTVVTLALKGKDVITQVSLSSVVSHKDGKLTKMLLDIVKTWGVTLN